MVPLRVQNSCIRRVSHSVLRTKRNASLGRVLVQPPEVREPSKLRALVMLFVIKLWTLCAL